MKTVRTLLLTLTICLSGCATQLREPISGYLCCNQTASKGWISSENVQGGSVVPFGQRVKIDSIKRGRYAYGAVGDQSEGFSEDNAKSDGATIEWLRQVIVAGDPTVLFQSWPSNVRAAVSANRVFPGMTRVQVAVALGHPARSETHRLDAKVWKYGTTIDDDLVELTFDDQGRAVGHCRQGQFAAAHSIDGVIRRFGAAAAPASRAATPRRTRVCACQLARPRSSHLRCTNRDNNKETACWPEHRLPLPLRLWRALRRRRSSNTPSRIRTRNPRR